MEDIFTKDRMAEIRESADFIRNHISGKPEIGIILGSGLGKLAEEIEEADILEYSRIPHFPVSTVQGHAGKLVCGRLGGKRVLVMKGRFHYYEGYDMREVVFPIWVMRQLGTAGLLVTNAAGGVSRKLSPGDLMIISDHIKFFSDSPLRGPNVEEYGERFPDMSNAYDKGLRRVAMEAGAGLGIDLKEGVYFFMAGPGYETPAEVKACSILGADAVGMSTVPEVIAAVHAGIKVLGISCITNMAAGILDHPLHHQEVVETAKMVEERFLTLVRGIVEHWPHPEGKV